MNEVLQKIKEVKENEEKENERKHEERKELIGDILEKVE